jgi:hypothetical protein
MNDVRPDCGTTTSPDDNHAKSQLSTWHGCADDAAVSRLVREHPADADVARETGRAKPAQSGGDRLVQRPFARAVVRLRDPRSGRDRLPPGPRRTMLKSFYDSMMMPIVYAVFRRDENKRAPASA